MQAGQRSGPIGRYVEKIVDGCNQAKTKVKNQATCPRPTYKSVGETAEAQMTNGAMMDTITANDHLRFDNNMDVIILKCITLIDWLSFVKATLMWNGLQKQSYKNMIWYRQFYWYYRVIFFTSTPQFHYQKENCQSANNSKYFKSKVKPNIFAQFPTQRQMSWSINIPLLDINILGGNKRSGRANEILATQDHMC